MYVHTVADTPFLKVFLGFRQTQREVQQLGKHANGDGIWASVIRVRLGESRARINLKPALEAVGDSVATALYSTHYYNKLIYGCKVIRIVEGASAHVVFNLACVTSAVLNPKPFPKLCQKGFINRCFLWCLGFLLQDPALTCEELVQEEVQTKP